VWGNNNSLYYQGGSGLGSCPEYILPDYIPFFKKFINQYNIETIVDLGCGDFRSGDLIYNDLNINYTGYDAYQLIIENNKNY